MVGILQSVEDEEKTQGHLKEYLEKDSRATSVESDGSRSCLSYTGARFSVY